MTFPHVRRLACAIGAAVAVVACGSDEPRSVPMTGPTAVSAEVSIDGPIEAINVAPGRLVVAGRSVRVTSATDIRDAFGARRLGDLRPGDMVIIIGREEDSVIAAIRIITLPAPNPPPAPINFPAPPTSPPPPTLPPAPNPIPPIPPDVSVEFGGTIRTIDGTPPSLTIGVAGRTVRTNGATMVRRRSDSFGLTQLRVGHRVQIRGVRQSDGSVLATHITVE